MRPLSTAESMPSICFVAHNAYGSLAGHNEQHAGGIERQQSTMAKWLARNGWRVSMVTWREHGDVQQEIDGVAVFPMCTRDAGLPVLRFFTPRWTSLVSAMRAADADLYYYNCGDLGLGQVVMAAHGKKRPCVFSVPSDPDCDPTLPALHKWREKTLYRYGLNRCDSIIVQSKKQRDMLQQGFGRDSTVLAMPCVGFDNAEDPVRVDAKPLTVVWVGRLSREKRPEWLLEAAKQLPQVRFLVVGAANRRSDYADEVQRLGESLDNVEMVGRVAHDQMEKYYRQADLLCCTSVYEGFPNVFLEAWSVGVPVLTTCDPDGLIERNEIGQKINDIEDLSAAIRDLDGDSGKRITMSRRAIRYFGEHHELNSAMGRFAALFESALTK